MEILSGYAAGSRIIKRPRAVITTVAVDVRLTIADELATLLLRFFVSPSAARDTAPRKIVARRRRRDEGGPPVP